MYPNGEGFARATSIHQGKQPWCLQGKKVSRDGGERKKERESESEGERERERAEGRRERCILGLGCILGSGETPPPVTGA